MLMGKRDFITVNVTNENTQVQIVKPEIKGDKDNVPSAFIKFRLSILFLILPQFSENVKGI